MDAVASRDDVFGDVMARVVEALEEYDHREAVPILMAMGDIGRWVLGDLLRNRYDGYIVDIARNSDVSERWLYIVKSVSTRWTKADARSKMPWQSFRLCLKSNYPTKLADWAIEKGKSASEIRFALEKEREINGQRNRSH